MAGMNDKDTGVKQNTEMQAIGLNFERWQDAVEAAIASEAGVTVAPDEEHSFSTVII